MVSFNTPPILSFTGDQSIAQQWMGVAKAQLNILDTQLSFQGLMQGSRVVSPVPGVTIECTKHFGTRVAVIHAEPPEPVIKPTKLPEDTILWPSVFYKVRFKTKPFDYLTTKNMLGEFAAESLTPKMIEGYTITPDTLSTDDTLIGRVSFVAVTADYDPTLSGHVAPTVEQLYSLGEIQVSGSHYYPLYKYNLGLEPWHEDPSPSENLYFKEEDECFYIKPPKGVAYKDSPNNKINKDLLINPATGEVAIWAFIRVGTTGLLPTQTGDIYDPMWFFALEHACKKSVLNDVNIPFSGYVQNNRHLSFDNYVVYKSDATNFPNTVYGWFLFDMVSPGEPWEVHLELDVLSYSGWTDLPCKADLGRYQYTTYGSWPATIHGPYLIFGNYTLDWNQVEQWAILTNVPIRKNIIFKANIFAQGILALIEGDCKRVDLTSSAKIEGSPETNEMFFSYPESARVFLGFGQNKAYIRSRLEMSLIGGDVVPFIGGDETVKLNDLVYAEPNSHIDIPTSTSPHTNFLSE